MDKNRSEKVMRYSFVLLSYNHSAYVEHALSAAFGQIGMGSYQVVVHDDASVDDSRGVIERWISAHRVAADVQCSDANVGTTQAVCRAALMSEGDYLILAASDDISDISRASAIRDALGGCQERVYGGFSDITVIDETGARLDPEDRPCILNPHLTAESIAVNFSGFLGASTFYHRDVFWHFGPVSDGILHEDMVLNFRAALLGRTIFLPNKLVRYRLHRGNVHSYVSAGGARTRLAHSLKIGRSLAKVAEQRCVDVIRARDWVSVSRTKHLWRHCVYWRSTHRIKVAVLSSRMGFTKALCIAFNNRVSFREIMKAAILRSYVGIMTRFFKSK